MMLTRATLFSLLLAWLAQTPAAQLPAAPPSEEDEVRGAIQQYYDAQAQRDPDRAASFWSANANPRMTRDTFVALFGPSGEDTYTVEIRTVTIAGGEARARVMVVKLRVDMRDGRPVTSRTSFVNSQTWRREAGRWRLLRDLPFADELADQYLAMSEAERPAFLAAQSPVDRNAIRYQIAQRASMAIGLRQDYRGGKALFQHALAIAGASGDRRSEANALHNIAQANYFLRDYAGATEYYEKELAVGREMDDADVSAAALFGLGTVAYSRAEYSPALGFYSDALALYEKRDDGPAIGRTAVSIGNVQYLQAEYDAASASYRRGLTLAVASYDRPGATFARRGLGRVLAAQGDLSAALDMYTQVLADARVDLQGDPRLKSNVGAALESVGEIYYRLGNTDQARTSLEEAKQVFESQPEDAARVLLTLGVTELVAGRFDAAFAAYSDSRARFEAAKNGEGVARAWVGVGFSQTARQKFAEAITAYRTAIGLFEKLRNNDGVARAFLGMSRAQSGAADDAAALESATKVAVIADGLKSDDLAWRAAERQGEALRRLKRLDEAKQAFERAAGAIDRLAADAPVNTEARGDLSDSASVWAGLALTLAAQGDAASALRAMEARRAHIRRVDFAPFQRDVAPGATPEELAEEQGIVREIISTRAQVRAEAQGRADPARGERMRQQLQALEAKRKEQQTRLYARLPELPMWRGVMAPPMEDSALADLVPGDRGLIVAYLVTDDELLIVSVARREDGVDVAATAAPLDRRAFAEALAAAMQRPVLESAAEWRTRAAPLVAALVTPIAARLTGRDHVVIVPDDLLWKVPFEALSTAAEGEADPFVTYATSLATLALERGLAPAEQLVPSFLAAPAIPEAIRAQLTLTLPSWKPQDSEAALAAALASAAPYGETTTVRAGSDASETTLRANVASSDVMHVQAPLQVSGAAPLLSSVILSSTGEAPAGNGRVEAREWFGMPAGRARVAVLPDGSTLGAAGVGNAMDPIAWAMSAAGVSTVVLGRWPADVFATDAVVAAFHAKLAVGASPTEAWRAAIAAAREKDAAPAAWAGARLIGGR
jgi:tetratricopeptide (TPR) repeat protein